MFHFNFFIIFLFLFCRCDNKQECKMWVNSDVFGDPCPGTHKYVEVHFACAPRILATTTKRPLPPWFLQGGADNLWNNPKKLSPTTSTTTFVSLILAPYSKIIIFKTYLTLELTVVYFSLNFITFLSRILGFYGLTFTSFSSFQK